MSDLPPERVSPEEEERRLAALMRRVNGPPRTPTVEEAYAPGAPVPDEELERHYAKIMGWVAAGSVVFVAGALTALAVRGVELPSFDSPDGSERSAAAEAPPRPDVGVLDRETVFGTAIISFTRDGVRLEMKCKHEEFTDDQELSAIAENPALTWVEDRDVALAAAIDFMPSDEVLADCTSPKLAEAAA